MNSGGIIFIILLAAVVVAIILLIRVMISGEPEPSPSRVQANVPILAQPKKVIAILILWTTFHLLIWMFFGGLSESRELFPFTTREIYVYGHREFFMYSVLPWIAYAVYRLLK